jgi:methionine biosynthesis protein MetW
MARVKRGMKSEWRLPTGELIQVPKGLRQDTALRVVRPGGRLLDVGCGRGAVASLLSARFDEVHGVDADDAALAKAAERGVAVAQVDLDREPLPYEDGSFDAVVSLDVIEHVLDPAVFVRELARVLRPGGRLYLATPNVRFAGYLRTLILKGRFPLTSGDPRGWQGGHIHFFTNRDLEELLRESGFQDVVHHGSASASSQRTLRYRVLARLLGPRREREFLMAGSFAEASRSQGAVPALARPETAPRAD